MLAVAFTSERLLSSEADIFRALQRPIPVCRSVFEE